MLRKKRTLWVQGLPQGTRSPLLRHGELYYLSLEEMCSLLPDVFPASLSIFSYLICLLHRLKSVLRADAFDFALIVEFLINP